MRNVPSRRVASLAQFAALLAEPALAKQKISIMVAAGQPPRASPGLALITGYFIPEVN